MSVLNKVKILLTQDKLKKERQKLDEADRRAEAANKISAIEFLVHKVLQEFHGINDMKVDRLSISSMCGLVHILTAKIVEREIDGEYQFYVEFSRHNGICSQIKLDDVTVDKIEDMVADHMKPYFKLEYLE